MSTKSRKKAVPTPAPEAPERRSVRTAFMVVHLLNGEILVTTDKDTLELAVPEVDILTTATPGDVEGLARSLANTLERQALVEAVVSALTPEPELTSAEKIAARLAEHSKE